MSKVTAGSVAIELRKLADSFDQNPDVEINKPSIYFSYRYGGLDARERFIALAKLLPRPLAKEWGNDFWLRYGSPAISIFAYIEQSQICRIVTPAQDAVYECDPLFSDDEIDEVTA